MNTLGLRASPKTIYFCVYDTDKNELVNLEKISIPNIFETPEKLKYLRTTILDIIREYDIHKAGIRLTEHHPKAKPNIQRVQYEGIIQEAFASSSLVSYFQGPITSIASRTGRSTATVKSLMDGKEQLEDMDEWLTYSKEEREAILSAMGAQNA